MLQKISNVTITYTKKFSEVPLLYLSFNHAAPENVISSESETDFTITFQDALTKPINLSWLAVLQTNDGEQPSATFVTEEETTPTDLPEAIKEEELGSQNEEATPSAELILEPETATSSALPATISGTLQ